MDPSNLPWITIVDGEGTPIATGLPVSISADDTFQVDDATAGKLHIGTVYLARFDDGSQPRAFRRQEAGVCRFYPRLIGQRVESFDLGGLTLKVTKSQVILDAVANNAGLMDPLMLTNLQNVPVTNVVVCEEGTRIQFEATAPWSGLPKGMKWEIGTSDDDIASGYGTPRLAPAGGSLLVVIDRYLETGHSILVQSLTTSQLASSDLGTQTPMTVTFRFFRLNGFQVAASSVAGVDLGLLSFALQMPDSVMADANLGAVVPGPETGDSIVAGTLSNVTWEASPFASVSVGFFVMPSQAIADALFGVH